MKTVKTTYLETVDDLVTVLGKEKFEQMLKQAINEVTWNGKFEWYWDYESVNALEENTINILLELESKYWENSKKKDYNLQYHFEEKLEDEYTDCMVDFDFDCGERLYKKFEELFHDEELEGYDVSYMARDLFDYAYDNNLIEVEAGLEEHLEDLEFNVNLLIGYGDEWNSEFTNIHDMMDMFQDGEFEVDKSTKYIISNNALTWLIYQQGYSLDEMIEYYKDSRFINSVFEESDNMTNRMNVLTVLGKVGFKDLLQMIERKGNWLIKKDSEIGFFSPWQGGGSCLEIELEKDFVLPSGLIDRIQIEGGKSSRYDYTVNEVYGLVNECWDNEIYSTDQEPAEFEIDWESFEKEKAHWN